MEQFLYTLAIIFSVYLISFLMINIRLIFTGNQFRGTCASSNELMADKGGNCSVCGSTPEEVCKNEDE